MSLADCILTWQRVRDFFNAAGYELPTEPPLREKWFRIRASDRDERNRSAAVKITADGTAVHLVDHANSRSETLQLRGDLSADPNELRQCQAEHERQRRKAEALRREAGYRRVLEARGVWGCSAVCVEHPYFQSKGVVLPGCRIRGAQLLVPLTDIEGELRSIQKINPDGSKRFYPGAPVAGASFKIGAVERDARVLVCEGAATAATLHVETGHAVFAAMFASNLSAVARELRDQYPDVDIVVAGDDDRAKAKNSGRAAATTAALAIGARLAFPAFCDACDGSCSDFNDVRACERRQERSGL